MASDSKTCPICSGLDTVRQVRCGYAGCGFVVTACGACDPDQAVAAFIADHEKDCALGPCAVTLVRSTFVAPRRAA